MENRGQEHYFPTKLEWLAVYLNAACSPRSNDLFDYMFLPGVMQNTLRIFVFLKPRAEKEKETLQTEIDALKSRIENVIAKTFRWDWVNLEIRKTQHPNLAAQLERELALEQARLN